MQNLLRDICVRKCNEILRLEHQMRNSINYRHFLRNYRLTYWLFIIMALLLGSGIVVSKIIMETNNKNVELIMSFNTVKEMSKNYGIPFDDMLGRISTAGITSIALEERSLETLQKDGMVTLLTVDQLNNLNRIHRNYSNKISHLINIMKTTSEYVYVICDNKRLSDDVRAGLTLQLGPDRVKELDMNILEIKGSEEGLKSLPLGFDNKIAKAISNRNLYVIPRLKQSFYYSSEAISAIFTSLSNMEVPVDKIIFEGDTILGYKNNFKATAAQFRKYGYNFGFIEFAFQKGDSKLAHLIPEYTMKVHSIPTNELSTYTVSQAVKRYFRAARERNIRLLFINPFAELELGPDMAKLNSDYITMISQALTKKGYHIGKAIQMDFSNVSSLRSVNLMFIIVGIWSVFMLIIDRFFKMNWYKHYVILSAVIIVAAIIPFISSYPGLYSGLALLAAIFFPTYAIISQFPSSKYEPALTLPQSIIRAAKIFLISLCGAMFVVILLSKPVNVVGVEGFSGVKIAFLAPLLFAGLYFFVEPDRLRSIMFVFKRMMQKSITIGYIAAIAAFAGLLLLYITRSGNNMVVPVSAHETSFREFLENLFYARPRTKEILLAYPVMIFSLYGANRFFKFNKLWIGAILATIAPISVINTFAHVHTPLLLSFFRSTAGLIVGIIVSLFVIGSYSFVKKYLGKAEK